MAKDARQTIQNKIRIVDNEVRSILNRGAVGLAKRIQNKHLSGSQTGSNRLAERTGRLKDSVRVIQSNTSGTPRSYVVIGSPYASVHFGIKGEETIIRPKSKKALTIPTEFAKDGRGATIGSAQSGKFKNTFIIHGNIIGQRPGDSRFLPLFTLKNQVRIPVRVDIQDDLLRPTQVYLERQLAIMLREF